MKKVFRLVLAGATIFGVALALDEKEYETKMKSAGDQMGALRKASQAGSMPDMAKAAKLMADALTGTDLFWAERKKDQAVGWAKDSVVAAKELATAAEAGNADGARTAMGKLGGSCKSCHTVHREQLPDKTYRIKPE